MVLANAIVILLNPRRPNLKSAEIDELTDTVAVHLCIPEHIL